MGIDDRRGSNFLDEDTFFADDAFVVLNTAAGNGPTESFSPSVGGEKKRRDIPRGFKS